MALTMASKAKGHFLTHETSTSRKSAVWPRLRDPRTQHVKRLKRGAAAKRVNWIKNTINGNAFGCTPELTVTKKKYCFSYHSKLMVSSKCSVPGR